MPVRRRQVGETVEPSVADGGFQRLAQGHDFLMHGVVGGRFAEVRDSFLMPVDAVFLNLAGGDFREAHLSWCMVFRAGGLPWTFIASSRR